jgi:DHA2 family multidrug resistance protein-like MFS transporter
MALGLGPVFTLAADLGVGAAPSERAGAAAAINETSSELGGALGIAVLGSIGAAVYGGETAAALAQGLQLIALISAAVLILVAAVALRMTLAGRRPALNPA